MALWVHRHGTAGQRLGHLTIECLPHDVEPLVAHGLHSPQIARQRARCVGGGRSDLLQVGLAQSIHTDSQEQLVVPSIAGQPRRHPPSSSDDSGCGAADSVSEQFPFTVVGLGAVVDERLLVSGQRAGRFGQLQQHHEDPPVGGRERRVGHRGAPILAAKRA